MKGRLPVILLFKFKMEDIVQQIVNCNTITETLVRITYCKTEYCCPSKAEIDHEDYDYNEDQHHHYNSKQFICILSVFGNKSDNWVNCPLFVDTLDKGTIHARRLSCGIKEMDERGIWTANSRNTAVYDTDHYHLIITKVEMLN